MRCIVFILLLLTACTPGQTQTAPSNIKLTPFLTSTARPATITAQTPEGLVAAETPLPSPTPFTYTVKSGDSISSIALQFGVSMDETRAFAMRSLERRLKVIGLAPAAEAEAA